MARRSSLPRFAHKRLDRVGERQVIDVHHKGDYIAPLVAAEKSWPAVFSELFKARLTFLVLLTTLVGFYIGTIGPVDYLLMLHTVLGTALVAAGASALNQYWERDLDARMRRTQDRPLPSGRMQAQSVLLIGCACSLVGLTYLAIAVNVLTSAIGACSLLTYVFVYTPLKRVTWLNTVVGAIPGGLPPLIGWTAARGHLHADGWALSRHRCKCLESACLSPETGWGSVPRPCFSDQFKNA